ncbi:MAG: carboxypeptidase regulatory-like domain-containing protein [Bryobacterales bacterium]|nr:carboxypeptidase regulatory-like domain-containing protein [Bryobacterales bacterium]
MTRFIAPLWLAAALCGQNSKLEDLATLSGKVLGQASGQPLKDVAIYSRAGSTKTDDSGAFELKNVTPGTYRITAFLRPNSAHKNVTLSPGETLSGIELRLPENTEITGRVLDENKEPMPEMQVLLVGREYFFGEVRYSFRDGAQTDDTGTYTLKNAMPGSSYLVMAQPLKRTLKPISEAPRDPKLRRKAIAPTFFPSSAVIEGAQVLTLRSGEHREAVDIFVSRTESRCLSVALQREGRPAAMRFEIGLARPTFGVHRDGGMFSVQPNGTSGPDGAIRICDLAPGDYRIVAFDPHDPGSSLGTAEVAIGNRDVDNVTVTSRNRWSLSGEVAWDGEPPKDQQPVRLMLSLYSLGRAPFSGESQGLNTTPPLPGRFTLPGLLLDDYMVRLTGVPKHLYLKDMTYGARSVMHQALRLGAAAGEGELRFLIGQDGGFINATVKDGEGKPVPHAMVLVMPAAAATEAALAETVVFGEADQNADYKSNALRPGKYYVVATTQLASPDWSPETVGSLWRTRIKAEEVSLESGQTKVLPLSPRPLN